MESRGTRTFLYSIVTALILSAILFLLSPRLLFKGNARWTYQNDTARVDVSFSGHLQNARVKAGGTNLKITQPKWLSSKNGFQGTVVEFPVSYRTKSYHIKLSPQADEWGDDATLIIKFRSTDFRHKGKRRPAWVTFRNITVNGQPVAAKKKVWHDQPFLLSFPRNSSEVTLSFDAHKPLASSDISFKNILAVFLVCLMFCLLLALPPKTECHIPKSIYGRDIVKVLSDGYRHIDPVYRRSFWIIFGVLCFVLAFHAICFMWGKNDWLFLDHNRRWLEHQWSGRYMAYSIKALFSDGVYLPLIYDLLTSITLALNAVLLCVYWRLKKRTVYFVLCGLVLTAQPFTLGMVYYVDMTPECFIGVTCVLAALLLSEDVTTKGRHIIRRLVYPLLSIILINFALAMYPVLITTIAVVFMGRLLVQAFDWDGSQPQLKSHIRSCLISAVHILLGIVLYKLVITFVFPPIRFYNTETLPLDQVPERLGNLLRQSFHQLYEYNMPFLPQWILWIFLGFTLVLAFHICSAGNFRQRIVRLSLLFGSLFATQTAMIIARTHVISGRIELFGLVFYEALVMMLVISRLRRFCSLWMILGAFIISASVLRDLDCLRVWKLGFDAEKMFWNRILTRLEAQPEFDVNKRYRIIQIGDPISLRKRYYTGHSTDFQTGIDILEHSYDAPWNVLYAPEFYYPTNFKNAKYRPHCLKPDYPQLKRLYQAGVLQKAEVWPGANGLIVWKDIILFVTDGRKLDNYKKQLERELGKK